MAIEKASDDDVTYVGADGADHYLKKGTWYQGWHKGPNGEDIKALHYSVAYWDGEQFLDEPDGEEREMHSFDFLVEAEVAQRPKLTPEQAFAELLVRTHKVVQSEMHDFPALKNAESCHRKGAEAFGAKDYVKANVWYLCAAGMSLGRERFKEYEDAATNSRVLAYAAFVKEYK